jgi:replicative DNA helicase
MYENAPITTPDDDPEVEKAVLCACITSSDLLWQALALHLEPEDLYTERNRIIFRALKDIGEEGSGLADEVLLTSYLRTNGLLERVGGAVYISSLTDWVPAPAMLAEHIKLLKMLRTGREIRSLCLNVMSIDAVEDRLSALEQGSTRIIGGAHEAEAASISSAAYDFSIEDLGEALDIPFERLNSKVRFRRGAMIILAGTPGAGKTSLALQIASGIGRSHQVLIGSGEMRMRELLERYVAIITGFSEEVIHQPSNNDKQRMEEALQLIREYRKITILQPGMMSPGKIGARARLEMAKNRDLGLVVADYLQLMMLRGGRARGMSRENIVGEMARQFKVMAQELNVPVLVCSQLSRKHKHDRRPPEMYDLRESGAIEAHADAVIMLDREEGSEETLVYIRKNRFGATGRARLRFCNGARFEEYSGGGEA